MHFRGSLMPERNGVKMQNFSIQARFLSLLLVVMMVMNLGTLTTVADELDDDEPLKVDIPIIEYNVDITWGAMEFVYSFNEEYGLGWSEDNLDGDNNKITITNKANSGAIDTTIKFEMKDGALNTFEADTSVKGGFYNNNDDAISASKEESNKDVKPFAVLLLGKQDMTEESKSVYFALTGKPTVGAYGNDINRLGTAGIITVSVKPAGYYDSGDAWYDDPDKYPVDLDFRKDVLKELIEYAEKFDRCWPALQEALELAKEVANNDDATMDDVNEAIRILRLAVFCCGLVGCDKCVTCGLIICPICNAPKVCGEDDYECGLITCEDCNAPKVCGEDDYECGLITCENCNAPKVCGEDGYECGLITCEDCNAPKVCGEDDYECGLITCENCNAPKVCGEDDYECGLIACENCNPPEVCGEDNYECGLIACLLCNLNPICGVWGYRCELIECELCNPIVEPDCPAPTCNGDCKLGDVLANGAAPNIMDALEILKFIVGMSSTITTGEFAQHSLTASLITQDSQIRGYPGIMDVLEILKYLVGLDGPVSDVWR